MTPRFTRRDPGLQPDGPLRAELGVPADAVQVTVEIEPRTRGSSDSRRLEAACAP